MKLARARLLAPISALMVVVVLAYPATASASPSFVEKGTVATGSGTAVTATLPSGTTSTDLLVAVVEDENSNCTTDDITAPSAYWVKAVSSCQGSVGPLQLWYYPDVSSGLTSFTFTNPPNGGNFLAQVSEWSGVAPNSPLDKTGANSNSNSSTTFSVSTSGDLAAASELAVTAFGTTTGVSSFTPGSGWANLGSGGGFDSDYRLSPPSGSALSEPVTAGASTWWDGAIATFLPACTGGSLTLETSPTVAFPSVTLNGYNTSSTTTINLALNDETGSGAGWNLNATSTTFSNGASFQLPPTATMITGAIASAASGNCSLPSNSVSYPVTLPAGATPPTAAQLFNAATNSGEGPTDLALTARVAVPANARATSGGTVYSSTWTLSLSSGP
ncbi:MAG TPA: hypothetical protein VME20_05720 [Acidimicrobiales bacterium]|nr:hypothetical protein [Acidimicrobiales bacterium]